MKNSCKGVNDQKEINAFVEGLEKGTLLQHTLKNVQPKEIGQMIAIASEYAAANDDARGTPLSVAQAIPGSVKK